MFFVNNHYHNTHITGKRKKGAELIYDPAPLDLLRGDQFWFFRCLLFPPWFCLRNRLDILSEVSQSLLAFSVIF